MSVIRKRLKEQARREILSNKEDLHIKDFANWVCCIEEIEDIARRSGLHSYSADVDMIIVSNDALEELYARWQIEREE